MLEIKNLCKTYHPKNGQPVQALKSVSAKFTEKGLVFILGKSGCGKSTLLNCIGGLDKFDSGEIVIKGKSSTEFTSSDFDSYRNTFIGFIFQEYNILSEFNIEKNIALALELQGKKADKKAVDNILEMVDLKEFGKRKTTELSGGQKQRVAIARALIKDPEIIVADEPTGALDSATGIQVFDTLKKLAQEKLVIVVSHDREFAEIYGDRIIEMKDGVIISDETKRKVAPNAVSDDLTFIGEDLIHIKRGHKFSQDEKDMIIKFLESRDTETIISVDDKKNQKFKQVAKIDDNNHTEKFTTTTDEDRKSKEYNKKDLKLIKSRLKWKDSFKMGASSLKSKPIRLAFTILLSLVAFTLFGFVDAISAYNKVNTTVKSIVDGNIKNLAFQVEKKEAQMYTDWETGEEEVEYNFNSALLTDSDIKKLKDELNINFKGVYSSSEQGIYLQNYKDYSAVDFNNSYLTGRLSGFASYTKEELESLGFTIYGDMPQNENEIVITEYSFKGYTFTGYSGSGEPIDASNINYRTDGNPNSIIGKEISLDSKTFIITGVVDTEFNYSAYESLDPTDKKNSPGMMAYMKRQELEKVAQFGYHSIGFVHEDYLKKAAQNKQISVNGMQLSESGQIVGYKDFWLDRGVALKDLTEKDAAVNVYMFNEYQTQENLTNKQIIVDISVLKAINYEFFNAVEMASVLNAFDSPTISMQSNITLDQINLIKASRSSFIEDDFGFSMSTDGDNWKIDSLYEVVGFCIRDEIYSTRSRDFIYANKNLYSTLMSNSYSFALASMPTDQEKIQSIVEWFYENYDDEDLDTRFILTNEVTHTILQINDLLESLSSVLIWVGLGFALFAALMLMNFISTSISYKKREIGILRALGARKSDVFGVFYNESLVIAAINFILSIISCFAVTAIVNNVLRNEYGIVITILNFGIRQILILAAVSVAVAFIASFLPVMKIAKKQPIDAINNR